MRVWSGGSAGTWTHDIQLRRLKSMSKAYAVNHLYYWEQGSQSTCIMTYFSIPLFLSMFTFTSVCYKPKLGVISEITYVWRIWNSIGTENTEKTNSISEFFPIFFTFQSEKQEITKTWNNPIIYDSAISKQLLDCWKFLIEVH